MALYGVLGDIHGNREGLVAVMEALARRGVTRLLCVGDIVGYNADPDACVSLLKDCNAACISGNHDLAGLGKLDTRRYPSKVIYSLKRTRRSLSPESEAWLSALPTTRVIDRDIVLVHGGVRDVEQYLVSPAQIHENAAQLRADFPAARLCLYGHSHEQRVYEASGEDIREIAPSETPMALERGALHFINPGAVDASRRQSGRLAECAILDTGAWSIEFLRTRYDAASTEIKAGMGGYRIGPWTGRFYDLASRCYDLASRLHALKRRFSRA